MIKRIIIALATVAALTAQASAQGGPGGGPSGPGPVPSPWVVNGSAISYNGCVLVPSSVTGGCKGNGTLNATVLYQAGFAVLSTDLANGKILAGNGSGVASPVTPSGDLTMTNAGVFTVSAHAITNAKLATALTSTLKGNPTSGTANVQDFSLSGLSVLAAPNTTLDLLLAWDHTAGTFKSVTPSALSSAVGGITALTGDATATGPGSAALTLATVNAGVGSFGSATQSAHITVNAKGLITAATATTITPAVGSITGLGTGVATALGVNVDSAGAFITYNGAAGTPSALVGTNITGTAAGLTAGNVTTNANLTGPITSVGNATSIASQTGTGTKFVVDTSPTIAGLTVTGSFTATGLVTNADLANSSVTVNGTSIALGASGTVTAAAGTLTGTTLKSTVVSSSLTSVGALTGGSTTTGFTINAASVTVSGQFPGSAVAVVADASGSPSATFGVMKADGTTIQCTSGTCSAVGGVATAVTVGTTTVNSGTNNYILTAGTGTLANVTIASLLTQGNGILVTGTTNAGIAVDVATSANFYSATANKIVDSAVPYTAVPTPAFSATPTFNFNTSASFAPGVMTANITSMTCSNLKANQGGFIKLKQDGTGGRTTVYCSQFLFSGGSAPALSSGANAVNYLIYTCETSTRCPASVITNTGWLYMPGVFAPRGWPANDNAPLRMMG